MMPARVLDQHEVEPPHEIVRQQPMAVEIVGKNPLEIAARLVRALRGEPGALPRLGRTLHDKRARRLAEFVRVGCEDAGLRLPEAEGEAMKPLVGAEPDVLVAPDVESR